jgi:hypothetical protein
MFRIDEQLLRSPVGSICLAAFNIGLSFTQLVDGAYKVGQVLLVFASLILTCFLAYKAWLQIVVLKNHAKTTPNESDEGD